MTPIIVLALAVIVLALWIAASTVRIARAEKVFADGLNAMHERLVAAERKVKDAEAAVASKVGRKK